MCIACLARGEGKRAAGCNWLVLVGLIVCACLAGPALDWHPSRAIEEGDLSGVRQMLKAGASPNAPDDIRYPALIHVGASVGEECSHDFIDGYKGVGACSRGRYTLFMSCLHRGLSRNANSNAKASEGYTREIFGRNGYSNSLPVLNSSGRIRPPVLPLDASRRIPEISRWYNRRPQVKVPNPCYNSPINEGFATFRVARATSVPRSRP